MAKRRNDIRSRHPEEVRRLSGRRLQIGPGPPAELLDAELVVDHHPGSSAGGAEQHIQLLAGRSGS